MLERLISKIHTKKTLNARDIVTGFTKANVIFGQNESGVSVFSTTIRKLGVDIPALLLCTTGDPATIRSTVSSIYKNIGQSVELEPGEVNLCEGVSGKHSGLMRVFRDMEGKQFSFCYFIGNGYEVEMDEKAAIATLTKILKGKKAQLKRKMNL